MLFNRVLMYYKNAKDKVNEVQTWFRFGVISAGLKIKIVFGEVNVNELMDRSERGDLITERIV